MEQKKFFFFIVLIIFLINFHFYLNFQFKTPKPILKLAVKKYFKISTQTKFNHQTKQNLLKSTKKERKTTIRTTENNQTKHILFYTNFWENKYWNIGKETVGNEHPHFEKCAFKNCIFTHDNHYLKNYTDYDALIFHTSEG